MTIASVLIGVLNCVLLVAILVLVGALVAWVASMFSWPIPWNIQRIYLLVVLIVFIICVVGLLLGSPTIHLIDINVVSSAFGSALSFPQERAAHF
jgi:hypothetical protein